MVSLCWSQPVTHFVLGQWSSSAPISAAWPPCTPQSSTEDSRWSSSMRRATGRMQLELLWRQLPMVKDCFFYEHWGGCTTHHNTSHIPYAYRHITWQCLIFSARNQAFDVVLVDTAGRMQDNTPLMTALAKLIAVNMPDLVLFVGEALVGNEAVDQLVRPPNFSLLFTHLHWEEMPVTDRTSI